MKYTRRCFCPYERFLYSVPPQRQIFSSKKQSRYAALFLSGIVEAGLIGYCSGSKALGARGLRSAQSMEPGILKHSQLPDMATMELGSCLLQKLPRNTVPVF